MAARKTTTKKSTKSAPKGKRAAQPQPEELGPILSRPVWGAIWGIVGLLCLLSILPIDGVLLKWLHRGIGALIGKGAYVMPFALIGIAVLLFARPGCAPARNVYRAHAAVDRQYHSRLFVCK
ncbi:MAG: hypothetical protein ACLSDM_06185 [Butyricicoccus sp.]